MGDANDVRPPDGRDHPTLRIPYGDEPRARPLHRIGAPNRGGALGSGAGSDRLGRGPTGRSYFLMTQTSRHRGAPRPAPEPAIPVAIAVTVVPIGRVILSCAVVRMIQANKLDKSQPISWENEGP